MNQPHPPTDEELNQKLVAQYTEIAALAGALAHEIKNPLSTIRLNMELLAEDFADSESPRDRRAAAKIAVKRAESPTSLANNKMSLAHSRRLSSTLKPACMPTTAA